MAAGVVANEKDRPKIVLYFRCSKNGLSFRFTPPHEYPKTHERFFSLIVGGRHFYHADDDDTPGSYVFKSDGTVTGKVEDISELTRDLFKEDVTELAVKGSFGVTLYSIPSGIYGGTNQKSEIVRFRERCSTWWADF